MARARRGCRYQGAFRVTAYLDLRAQFLLPPLGLGARHSDTGRNVVCVIQQRQSQGLHCRRFVPTAIARKHACGNHQLVCRQAGPSAGSLKSGLLLSLKTSFRKATHLHCAKIIERKSQDVKFQSLIEKVLSSTLDQLVDMLVDVQQVQEASQFSVRFPCLTRNLRRSFHEEIGQRR